MVNGGTASSSKCGHAPRLQTYMHKPHHDELLAFLPKPSNISLMTPANLHFARRGLGHLLSLLAALALVVPICAAEKEAKGAAAPPKVPEDLVGDEHVREEFGVNEFTTPSIRKIFDQLDSLGTLNYDGLKRPLPDKPPGDRVALSLSLGTLIADGFLIVQCEKIEEMENVGRALLKYAKALGAGMRINKHSQSLLENSVKGDWKKLRAELASTQSDVEAEMVLLRDSDVAHLISLGGWLRAFEISTTAITQNYTPEKSRQLGRSDIVEYYMASLQDLHPEIKKLPVVQDLTEGLQAMHPLLDVPSGKAFTEEEVKDLRDKAKLLIEVVRQTMPKK